MKLLTKISKNYAVFSLAVLVLGIVLIYFFIKHFITFETAEKLQGTKQRVIKSINEGRSVDFAPFIEVHQIAAGATGSMSDEIKDTVIDKDNDGHPDAFIEYHTYYTNADTVYSIIIRSDSLEETELLLSIGGPALLALLLVLTISSLVMNRINKSVWNPFYHNLNRLKIFSISDKSPLVLQNSNIDEFKDLNISLAELTEKLKSDYQKQKEFSENVSHELQTPLAIINAKIEALLQKEYPEEETIRQLRTIYKTVNRLSRLNKSLILLSKLESQEYEEKKTIPVRDFVENCTMDFAEILKTKEISLVTELVSGVSITMNEDLFGIVINNLLINAVRYNIAGGQIIVSLDKDTLTFKNTGTAPVKEPHKMFERFEKGSQSGDSSGLGLTIVKQICDLNNLTVSYIYEKEFHIIAINFGNK